MSDILDSTITLDESMEYEVLKNEYKLDDVVESLNASSSIYDANVIYNESIQEIAKLELSQRLSGDIAIFENTIGGTSLWEKFINAAKAFFKKMLENIIMAWNWASKMLDKYILANSVFVTKYSRYLENIDSIEFENGYKFAGLQPPSVYKMPIPDKLERLSDEDKRLKKNKIIYEISNEALAASHGNPSAEFHQLYFGDLYPNDVYDIKQQLSYIKFCNMDKKRIVAPFKAAVAEMKTLSVVLDGMTKISAKSEVKHMMDYVELSKYNAEILFAAYTEYLKALMARTNQARAICIQALHQMSQTNTTISPSI